jgi:hypothetical protein
MALRFPEPPDSVTAAADALGDAAARGFGAAPPPQPVFTARLDALVDAAGAVDQVAEAPTSWRYATGRRAFDVLVEDGGARTLSAGDDRFGPAIDAALARAADDPRIGSRDYEVRLLRVPALNLLAVWLHTPHAPDLFDAHDRLYEADEFQALLRDRAATTQARYADAEAPDELGG